MFSVYFASSCSRYYKSLLERKITKHDFISNRVLLLSLIELFLVWGEEELKNNNSIVC